MEDALKAMASVLSDGITASDTGPSFTCQEADTLARVLVLGGHLEAAAYWLSGHAAEDETGDSHYNEEEGRPMTVEEVREYASDL